MPAPSAIPDHRLTSDEIKTALCDVMRNPAGAGLDRRGDDMLITLLHLFHDERQYRHYFDEMARAQDKRAA